MGEPGHRARQAGSGRLEGVRGAPTVIEGAPRSHLHELLRDGTFVVTSELQTTDGVTAGDHPETKPIYDIDSIHALRIARIMRDEGTYLSGRPLSSPPSFLIGAVENPFSPPVDYRPQRLLKKIEAGAEFFQTQI